jgi:CRP-like cAMP-binding protein
MTTTIDVPDILRSVLREAPLLAPLTRDERTALAAGAEMRSASRGERLFREGDPAREVFFVASGRVQCCHHCEGPREWVSAVVRPAGVVGLVDVLQGAARGGCAQALEPSTVVALPSQLVLDLVDGHVGFAAHVARALARELRQTQHMCGAVALRSPLQRLAEYLLDAANGTDEGALPETQGRIASQIGTVREVVGRSLRRLERQGVLTRRGRTFRLLRREELERLAR